MASREHRSTYDGTRSLTLKCRCTGCTTTGTRGRARATQEPDPHDVLTPSFRPSRPCGPCWSEGARAPAARVRLPLSPYPSPSPSPSPSRSPSPCPSPLAMLSRAFSQILERPVLLYALCQSFFVSGSRDVLTAASSLPRQRLLVPCGCRNES
jgi:hypothetical protein